MSFYCDVIMSPQYQYLFHFSKGVELPKSTDPSGSDIIEVVLNFLAKLDKSHAADNKECVMYSQTKIQTHPTSHCGGDVYYHLKRLCAQHRVWGPRPNYLPRSRIICSKVISPRSESSRKACFCAPPPHRHTF
jgi:hypothetical protein